MTKLTKRPGTHKQLSIPNTDDQKVINQAIKQILDIGLGRLPNVSLLRRFIVWQDLVNLGVAEKPDPAQPLRMVATPVYNPETDSNPPPQIHGLLVTEDTFSNVLTWEMPLYERYAYTEVWRAAVDNLLSAVRIGTSVDPTYNDDVQSSTTLYYWVRAISTAGVPGPFNSTAGTAPISSTVAAPSTLSLASGTAHLLLAGDGTVISRIWVSWTNSTDTAVVEHTIQYKKSADTEWIHGATITDLTQTEFYIGPVEDAVDYDVRIRAVRINGRVSAWTTASNHTVIGKTADPEDVTGFTVVQNDNVVVFQWDQVADIDLGGYEIRYAPITAAEWSNGFELTDTTRGTQVTTAAVPPGDWAFMIKARDTSRNYSTNETIVNLSVVSNMDVIVQVQQAPDWLGTKTNFIKHWTGVLIPDDMGVVGTDYLNFEWCDQFVPDPYLTCEYEAPEIDIAFDDIARVWGQISASLGPGISTKYIDPELYLDYRKDADAYDGFEIWTIGTVEGRYFKMKFILTTGPDAGNKYSKLKITSFLPSVDQDERIEHGQNVIAASGSTVSFSAPFHSEPNIVATIVGSSALIIAIDPAGITTAGFDVNVFNTSDADVGGTINWTATGV